MSINELEIHKEGLESKTLTFQFMDGVDIIDAHPKKTDLKVFVVVIPKEACPSFFWYDTDF